jgi:hypothetical protein
VALSDESLLAGLASADPVEQRRCLLLAVFHGLSGCEISELDDIRWAR